MHASRKRETSFPSARCLENICKEQGLTFIREKDSIKVKGPLKSGRFTVPGDVSSQFISGLLFALPLLDGDSVIDNPAGRK